MNAEIEREKEKIIQEWLQRAIDDFESAEIILREKCLEIVKEVFKKLKVADR